MKNNNNEQTQSLRDWLVSAFGSAVSTVLSSLWAGSVYGVNRVARIAFTSTETTKIDEDWDMLDEGYTSRGVATKQPTTVPTSKLRKGTK